jgi:hypothetical protein
VCLSMLAHAVWINGGVSIGTAPSLLGIGMEGGAPQIIYRIRQMALQQTLGIVGKVSPLSGYGKSVRYLASTSVCTGRPPRSPGRADGQLERVQAAAMEGSTQDPDQRPNVQFYVLRL